MNDLSAPTQKREKQRDVLNRYLGPPVEFLIRHGFTPNILSYMGFTCSVLAAFFIAIGSIHFPIWFTWPAPFLMFWSGAFDVFDGEVARRTGKEGPAGAFLDSNLDRLSDAVIILSLVYGGFIDFLLGISLLFLTVMISYTRSRAENEGLNMKGVGLMERAERVIAIIAALILETWIYFFTGLIFGTPVTLFFTLFIWVFTMLLIFTLGQRIIFTFRELGKIDKKSEKRS